MKTELIPGSILRFNSVNRVKVIIFLGIPIYESHKFHTVIPEKCRERIL